MCIAIFPASTCNPISKPMLCILVLCYGITLFLDTCICIHCLLSQWCSVIAHKTSIDAICFFCSPVRISWAKPADLGWALLLVWGSAGYGLAVYWPWLRKSALLHVSLGLLLRPAVVRPGLTSWSWLRCKQARCFKWLNIPLAKSNDIVEAFVMDHGTTCLMTGQRPCYKEWGRWGDVGAF